MNQNGFLYRKSSGEIPVRFDVLTSESPELKKFSFEKNKFSDFLDTWKGGESTSQKNGVWLGTWGSEHYLNDDISVIEIRGEKSTVTAIRIDLNEIQEGHPLIISGGELEGSTIALALSDDGPRTYLLVFHAGYRADNPDWLPGQQGVAGIYRAHLAMAGEYITDWTISDTDILVDGSGTTLGHHALDDILRLYKAGWVTYSGQLPKSSPGVTSAAPTIKWIDYAKGATGLAPAKGHAYALVTNIKGQWQIDLHAKLAPSLSVPDGTTQTRLKT